MADNETQNDNPVTYKKMSNIYLMSLINASSATNFPADGSAIDLMTTLSNPTSVSNTRSSHIYKNISIPVGTTDFLFYATRELTTPATADTKFKEGVINSSLYDTNNNPISTTSGINF